ncbi:TniB family NTP-binding protein [Methyloversatilis discipulorum]|uniref:TniB family NTP-binding protein n=1 Tax=Methyloversatilis discipulorum TaxID=1119528 RepID=UPI001A41A0D6|nr:TniB family NTP-binding protein [Methyloversatilis discipulorum]MBL8467762.1 TniB family NTP-binding protein [Methyloversatilis discipulorum]
MRFIDEDRWVPYSAAKEIVDELVELLRMPRRNKMDCLVIVGESNIGKTQLIRQFVKEHGQPYAAGDETIFPVVLVESPATPSEKGLLMAILESMKAPYSGRDNREKLKYQVENLFARCKVKMLIIDEFHSMGRGSPLKKQEALNIIKSLCNVLSLPIVGVGTSDVESFLSVDKQMESRFQTRRLRRWEANRDFQKLLSGFEQTLPLRNASNLKNGGSAELLFELCKGNLGDLHRFLRKCAKHAIQTGAEVIDVNLIKEVRDRESRLALGSR